MTKTGPLALRVAAALAVATLAIALPACSESSGTTPDGGGTGSGGSGGGGSGGGGTGGVTNACPGAPNLEAAAPACNTVVNGATAIPFTAATGSPPAATGGDIRDGVYRAIRADGYGTVAAAGRRLSIVILGNATQWLWAGDVLDAAGTTTTLTFRANVTAAVSGTQVLFTTTCMSGATSPVPAALDFIATPDQLLLSRTDASGTAVTTYARAGCP